MGEEDDTKAKHFAFQNASGGLDKNATSEDSISAAKNNTDADLLPHEPDTYTNDKRRSADSDNLDPELVELMAADLYDCFPLTRDFQEVQLPHVTQQNRIPPSAPTATNTPNDGGFVESAPRPTKRSRTSRGEGKKVTVNAAAEFFAATRGSWIAPKVHAGTPSISSTRAHLSPEYILHHQHLRHDQSVKPGLGPDKSGEPDDAARKAQTKSCPAGDPDSILLRG